MDEDRYFIINPTFLEYEGNEAGSTKEEATRMLSEIDVNDTEPVVVIKGRIVRTKLIIAD